MRRLYGHIAWNVDLPGPALCGKPNRRARGPAVFFCGKCVAVMIGHANRDRTVRYTITIDRDGGAA